MKEYSKPMAEKIVFDYTTQVVASGCSLVWSANLTDPCSSDDPFERWNDEPTE